jgi:importin subunit beta-1
LASQNIEEIKCGATCVASIAQLELPKGEWPGILETLCSNCASDSLLTRSAALTTLGYLSEDLDANDLDPSQIN